MSTTTDDVRDNIDLLLALLAQLNTNPVTNEPSTSTTRVIPDRYKAIDTNGTGWA